MPGDSTRMSDLLNSWRATNFPNAAPTDQLLGVQEEVGELAHHHLKDMQNIRGTHEEHVEGMRDAVGDILIYLQGYCHLSGWDMFQIYMETGAKIIKRDWIDDPVAGGETTAIGMLKEMDDHIMTVEEVRAAQSRDGAPLSGAPSTTRETPSTEEVKEWEMGRGK